jgi:Lrp/AsnC family transcriptional regulator for asnA, asnC and gidA
MTAKTPDSLDHRIIRLLAEKGSSSAGEIAARLGVTAPTVRARIKNLEKAGLLKVAGLIDPYQYQDLTAALIGLNIRSYGKLDKILQDLSQIENVTWAAVVTGRYDIILEVIIKGGMKELYQLTTDIIPKLGHVLSSETFVIMKSKDKWICLPKGLEDR